MASVDVLPRGIATSFAGRFFRPDPSCSNYDPPSRHLLQMPDLPHLVGGVKIPQLSVAHPLPALSFCKGTRRDAGHRVLQAHSLPGIRTADRQNMQKLAEKLRTMQAILEFRISPIGD